MNEIEEQFQLAKSAYKELIDKDFPDFNLEEYIKEKEREANEAESTESSEPKPKTKMSDRIASKLDLSGDGKLDKDDFSKMPKAVAGNVASAAQKFGKTVSTKATSFDAKKVATDAKSFATQVGKNIADTEASEVLDTAAKIGKTAVGVQGFQDRGEAKQILQVCGEYYDAAEEVTEQKRQELNFAITSFGEYRLNALHKTVGRFLEYLKKLKQKNAAKEYEILCGAEIDTKTLDKMERMDMAVSEALRSTAITGSFGAAAVLGTPALVTGAVTAFATASTGTAISTLSGAAANSAVLAWLGGGSLAAGGGGMAAGAAALTAVTVGATAVVTILSAGTIVSLHYGKKLTEAKDYERDVGIAVANLEKAWIVMEGISKRTAELREVTEELLWRTADMLSKLEDLLEEFDFSDAENVKVFNKCAHLVKTMVELAQTPLLDDDGNLSNESMQISSKVRKVLNTEV